jgi:hypothetical protein
VLWKLCYGPTAVSKLCLRNKYAFVMLNRIAWILPNNIQTFDYFSCPIATWHTWPEVRGWFKEAGIKELRDDDPTRDGKSYYAKIYPSWCRNKDGTVKKAAFRIQPPWALTVMGQKKPE